MCVQKLQVTFLMKMMEVSYMPFFLGCPALSVYLFYVKEFTTM